MYIYFEDIYYILFLLPLFCGNKVVLDVKKQTINIGIARNKHIGIGQNQHIGTEQSKLIGIKQNEHTGTDQNEHIGIDQNKPTRILPLESTIDYSHCNIQWNI